MTRARYDRGRAGAGAAARAQRFRLEFASEIVGKGVTRTHA